MENKKILNLTIKKKLESIKKFICLLKKCNKIIFNGKSIKIEILKQNLTERKIVIFSQ